MASTVPSSPLGMNSPQPSRTWRPELAAWFFRHSLYRIGEEETAAKAEAETEAEAFTVVVLRFDPLVATGEIS
uniref:Uncharacterized protein n=1 Tax=Cannabis sativa TaxID=3483 RepID=A0A803PFE3_CANSA